MTDFFPRRRLLKVISAIACCRSSVASPADDPTTTFMPESVIPRFWALSSPGEIPGLVTFWHFAKSADAFVGVEGKPLRLVSRSGPLSVIDDATAPLGGKALHLNGSQWLDIPRRECPTLNFSGPRSQHTLVAWIYREEAAQGGCEFVAGMWNESHRSRQYGMFLNIPAWGQPNQLTGHLSHVGGPTPGLKFCADGPVGATPVPRDRWSVIAVSYDGVCGRAWLNGSLDFRPGLNPYSLAGGLFDGGENGSDFTVGAVDAGGKIQHYFTGRIAGIAAYNRALTPAEIFALSTI